MRATSACICMYECVCVRVRVLARCWHPCAYHTQCCRSRAVVGFEVGCEQGGWAGPGVDVKSLVHLFSRPRKHTLP